MDCREFREKHFAFVDDTLPGIELVGMQLHLTDCEECSRRDSSVRRSLMLFRNLPSIEPSADFSSRLRHKLELAKAADASEVNGFSRRFSAAIAVTSIVMLGYIGLSLRQVDFPQDLVLPPVVASIPESAASPMMSPGTAMVASVSAGLPMWTAALFAEQAPVHFASIELATATK
ncbi:MAG: zf-HC2 domain-containing protein [Gemmatimonadales bacterium]